MLTDHRQIEEETTPPPPERRAGKRHQSVLLVGKVRRGGVETACLVHDISHHGMMARFPQDPAVGDELWIEVRGLPPALATVRWVKGRKAGLQFAEQQPVERVFQLKRDDGLVARPPRFPLFTPALLRFDAAKFRADALDISAGGAKLASDHEVQPGQTGQLTLVDTGTSVFGKVCWAHDGQFGFRFCAPLPLNTLAQILQR